MQVVELTAVQARIRLRTRVRHASYSRAANDTLLVCCRLSDGTVGWGEGLPRPYVTGETIETAFRQIRATDWQPLADRFSSLADVLRGLEQIHLPRPADQRECFGNSVRCAVELALLDAACRSMNRPFKSVMEAVAGAEGLRQERNEVRYSAAVTSMSPAKAFAMGVITRAARFRQCKAKVGARGTDDVKLLRSIRRGIGRRIDLRIDANEAWHPDELAAKLKPLLPFDLSAVEQPVPHALVDRLGSVKEDVPVPIVLDESLCSDEDARRAIAAKSCDVFNVRLSKCGGFVRSVKLVLLARAAGLGYQLGCQVGETGILSAAGRHFASTVGGLRYVEGSFDRFLVRDRLTVEDLTFGWGGLAPALSGPGLGVTVDERAVRRVARYREPFAGFG